MTEKEIVCRSRSTEVNDPTPSKGKNSRDQLPVAFVKSIVDPDARKILTRCAETFFDAASEEVLKDVPFVGLIIKLAKTPLAIRDWLFLRKLATFIAELSSVEDEKMSHFRHRISTDVTFARQVGEGLILLLDRADDMEKPALMGKACAAYLAGKVTYDQLTRMNSGIDRAMMADIRQLPALEPKFTEEYWGAGLVSAGLARLGVRSGFGGSGPLYILNDTGKLVIEHCLAMNEG
jgi:hypothetical protein